MGVGSGTVWGKVEVCREFWWGNLKEGKDNFKN
jgi:hypothetical protein